MSSIPVSEHFPSSFHRVIVKGLVVKDGKLLLLKEAPSLGGQWELPGGGLDFTEDIHEALKREIEEETGIKVKSIEKRPMYTWTTRFENTRGMDWYFSLVIAFRVEVESLDFKITEECEDIGFFSKEELSSVDLYRQAQALLDIFEPKDFE